MDQKVWLRSWEELGGVHIGWRKMDHKPQRKRHPKQNSSQSTNSRSDLSTRPPEDGARSNPCSPFPPPQPRQQGQKAPKAPSPTRAPPELPWTEDVPSSLFSVPGKKPCFPEAPQDFTPQPQMGLQSCSLLTWHLKVHTEIMCRKERSH